MKGVMLVIEPNDVIDIFARRAGGATVLEIAEQYPFSTAIVSDVLYRRRDEGVPIPKKILEKVQSLYRKRYRAKPTLPPVSLESALAQYTASCARLDMTYRDCVSLGIPTDTLDLLAESLTELRTAK